MPCQHLGQIGFLNTVPPFEGKGMPTSKGYWMIAAILSESTSWCHQ